MMTTSVVYCCYDLWGYGKNVPAVIPVEIPETLDTAGTTCEFSYPCTLIQLACD
jgi:hypothetical protein